MKPTVTILTWLVLACILGSMAWTFLGEHKEQQAWVKPQSVPKPVPQSVIVRTASGAVHYGYLVEQTEDQIVIDSHGKTVVIKAQFVESITK